MGLTSAPTLDPFVKKVNVHNCDRVTKEGFLNRMWQSLETDLHKGVQVGMLAECVNQIIIYMYSASLLWNRGDSSGQEEGGLGGHQDSSQEHRCMAEITLVRGWYHGQGFWGDPGVYGQNEPKVQGFGRTAWLMFILPLEAVRDQIAQLWDHPRSVIIRAILIRPLVTVTETVVQTGLPGTEVPFVGGVEAPFVADVGAAVVLGSRPRCSPQMPLLQTQYCSGTRCIPYTEQTLSCGGTHLYWGLWGRSRFVYCETVAFVPEAGGTVENCREFIGYPCQTSSMANQSDHLTVDYGIDSVGI